MSVIALHLADLGLRTRPALDRAARAGYRAVQLTTDGELSPANLTRSGRRDLGRLLRDLGLAVVGLDLGPQAGELARAAETQRHVDQAVAAMELARDLGCRTVVGRWGLCRAASTGSLHEALAHLAGAADTKGIVYAGQSPAAPAELGKVLGAVNAPSLAVAADPAEWLLAGADPTAIAGPLAGRVAAAYADDALVSGPNGRRVAVGDGQLDWPTWLAALAQCDATGPQVVRLVQPADAVRSRERLEHWLGLAPPA